MSSIKLESNASGTGIFTIASPNSNTNRTLSIPDTTTTIVGTDATQTLTNKTLGSGLVMGASALTSQTAVVNPTSPASASIDFTGIPSWVKRITVMFSGVSLSGTSDILVQLGDAGGFETTGYIGRGGNSSTTPAVAITTSTAGFPIRLNAAANSFYGHMTITNITSNTFVSSFAGASGTLISVGGGDKTLSDTLTQVRITTVNGTDTFDAGTINIMYE